MANQTALDAMTRHYDPLPPNAHATGDIWCNLYCPSIRHPSSAMGVVITPACDLEQNKTEVTTLLPVVGVHDWFSLTPGLKEIAAQLNNLIKNAGINRSTDALTSDLKQPDQLLSELCSARPTNQTKTAIQALTAAGALAKEPSRERLGKLVSALPSLRKTAERIVANNLRNDLFFGSLGLRVGEQRGVGGMSWG